MKSVVSVILGIVVSAAVSIQAADAGANYDKHCAKCHGKDGKGQTKMGKKLGAKDYTDAKVQADMKDDAAFKGIKEGIKEKGKEVMKPAEGMSDAEITALVKHMRTFKK